MLEGEWECWSIRTVHRALASVVSGKFSGSCFPFFSAKKKFENIYRVQEKLSHKSAIKLDCEGLKKKN